MADHAHKQIRGAVVTALTGLTTSGARVYTNRLMPMESGHLPGLRIYLDDEQVDAMTLHAPYAQDRSLALAVECCAKGDSLDDTLDLMSKEVEVALAAGLTVGGKFLQPVYGGMEFTDELADQPVGIKRLRFTLTYSALSNAPDVLI